MTRAELSFGLFAEMGTRRVSLDRLFPYLLLAITAAALIPVFQMGFFEPIGGDGYENMSISTQASWDAFLCCVRGRQHPILSYIVLRVFALFGHSRLAWRTAPIIPGMAGVYLLGMIAARLCRNKAAALLAAAAYGFSATMREIIVDIRSYSLALFFVLAAFYCLVDSLAGNARRNRSLILFGIFSSLAVISEYYAILFLLACLSSLALLLAAHPLSRGRALAWARRNWPVLITAIGLPFASAAYSYWTHGIKFPPPAFEHLLEFYWRPGTSLIDFVLRNLRADFNYMLPVEMTSAGGALGVLAAFVPLLLYRALFRKQSHKAIGPSLPGLLCLLLLAELIVLSLLRWYPFGGEARQQSILFPFITLTAFLFPDQLIGSISATRRLGWLRFGVLVLAGAGIVFNYSGVKFQDAPSSHAAPAGRATGRAAQPAHSTRGKAGIRWVSIPGGTFMMGADDIGPSSQPRHKVTIRPFEMAQTLVTNKQYRECVDAGVCTKGESPGPWLEEDYQPVVGVNWEQAQVFSRWVGGRLPSEAEWAYAARSGGREQKYPWGDEEVTCEHAVIGDCGGYEPTAPVCSKPAGNTRQGLCDMAGNAFEWVQDWYHDSYSGAPTDGSAWESPTGSDRVYRGGSWGTGASDARSASRGHHGPGFRNLRLGFRPAR